MTNRDRFLAVLNGKMPDDRLPVVEWASWWDLTLNRWHGEGLDPALTGDELFLWDAGEPAPDCHTGPRIGIDYAQEAVEFPWRFWI